MTSDAKKKIEVEMQPVVSTTDCLATANLAQQIWRQHFTPIIGEAQVEYMLAKFQSADAIAAQIESGWEYYLAKIDDEAVGYTGLVPEPDKQKMMLSKIYVKQSARGQGVGRVILDFIEARCNTLGFTTLWLTVNRFNEGPVEWYTHHGFVITDEVKKNIGGGFLMDDFIMEKRI